MLPIEFETRFKQLCPTHLLEPALASFRSNKSVSFRINGLRADLTQYPNRLESLGIPCSPVDWLGQQGIRAYIAAPEARQFISHSALAEQGTIYMQSLSSMLAPLYLEPSSSDWVLDLAAAPGGKTSLVADLMNNKGQISAVEPVKDRFFRMQANLRRLGVQNAKLFLKDGRAVGTLKPDTFDRVLLDAPCSSESRMNVFDEASTFHWSPRKVKECARKQKRLILSGFDALKPGGVMLYCTCSFAPEENEAVVNHLLHKRQNAQVAMLQQVMPNCSAGLTAWQGKQLDEKCGLTQRIWPNEEIDGFFLAKIKKAISD